jgi:hypothetical protein
MFNNNFDLEDPRGSNAYILLNVSSECSRNNVKSAALEAYEPEAEVARIIDAPVLWKVPVVWMT